METARQQTEAGVSFAVWRVIHILTYQDFQVALAQNELLPFLSQAIAEHRRSDAYKTAVVADAYERQQNTGISEVVRKIYTAAGVPMEDFTAANNKLASNFFHRLNTQRVTYSLGNGVTFTNTREETTASGALRTVDATKALFSVDFDTVLSRIGMAACEHGAAYGFLNREGNRYRVHFFPLTQFVPLIDENDGALKAGIRFWSLDWGKRPVLAVLYELDGYTKYTSREGTTGTDFVELEPKRPYTLIINSTEAGGREIVGGENYAALPIVPLYGNEQHQSTLIGLKGQIDSYDMIQSGFANDLEDCAQVYWLIGDADGMTTEELDAFRDRLRTHHIAVADMNNSSVTPYTQDIPYQAREAFLAQIERAMYRDFGAFNPSDISAGQKTATEIQSAYQPMDEEADAFEYQVIEFVQQLLRLIGVEDTPQFKRNRISNQMEQVEMVISEANYLDDETVLDLLPNITPEMKSAILARRDAQNAERLEIEPETPREGPEQQEDT